MGAAASGISIVQQPPTIIEYPLEGPTYGPPFIDQPFIGPPAPTVTEQPFIGPQLPVVDNPTLVEPENGYVSQQPFVEQGPNVIMSSNTVRVGRWMSQQEYDKMISTGMVQESDTGTTHVAFPADSSAFGRQAPDGSLYVEFDVPEGSVVRTSDIWGKILGPNTIEARLAEKKGLPKPEMPEAKNVEVKGKK
ncbi:hypothetical protein [Paenibacillus hamazuiensis]|uniref:TreTu family toxin n=1 Tax=Paenibacillus hamazuiensis TaxID=2936508 RepID=UPI00200F9882|nr:hypothetical protein [Paenibacillus hamazuiensis]